MIPALTFATYAVSLNGRPVLPHVRAAVAEGRVLLPARALGDALGAQVRYDATTRTIAVRRGTRTAAVPLRGVRVVRGSAYAPLRETARAFGLDIAYRAATRTIALDDAGPPAPQHAAAAQATASYLAILTPADGSRVGTAYPAIAARFAGLTTLDPRSLSVMLDGRDVTADASTLGDRVLFTPRSALPPGTHTVSMTGRDANGTPFARTWSFDDDFAFSSAPAAAPPAIVAIGLDRVVSAGSNAFDVVVSGMAGLTGYVGVDGIAQRFPLFVRSSDSYVAHVIVPAGLNEPFAHVGARITLPDGTLQSLVLPQTVPLFTGAAPTPPPLAPPLAPSAVPSPHPTPRRRSVEVPGAAAATPGGLPRRAAGASPAPSVTPTPGPTLPPSRRRVPLSPRATHPPAPAG